MNRPGKCFIFCLLLSIFCCVEARGERNEYWHQRKSLFDVLPVESGDIVFFGNSITDGGEFHELFGMTNIKNRGIIGDNITGLIERVDQVASGQPAKIFLLIGINDIANGDSEKQIIGNYENLLKLIRQKTPETQIFVQSIMPVNNDFKRYKGLIGKERMIPSVNKKLKHLAETMGCTYIDLWPVLAEPKSGKLRKDLTPDGLHLNGTAYKAWAEILLPYIGPTQ